MTTLFICERCGVEFYRKWRTSEQKKYKRDGYRFCSRRCSDNRLHLKEDAFREPLPPEALYWLGFLVGDGNISENRIALGLSIKDRSHIEKFARFLGCGADRIHDYFSRNNFGNNYKSEFRVRSDSLVDQLKRLGLTENKSTKETVLPRLRSSLDLLRGLIDSDGSVCSSGPAIGLCGSFDICSVFHDLALQLTGSEPKISPQGKIFTVKLGTQSAKILSKALYYPNCVSLSRKEKEARSMCEKS